MADKIDDLTGHEAAEAERVAGFSLGSLSDDSVPKLALLGAVAWLHARREDPKLTYDAYMKATKSAAIVEFVYGGDDEVIVGDPFPGDGGDAEGEAGPGEGGVLPADGDSAE